MLASYDFQNRSRGEYIVDLSATSLTRRLTPLHISLSSTFTQQGRPPPHGNRARLLILSSKHVPPHRREGTSPRKRWPWKEKPPMPNAVKARRMMENGFLSMDLGWWRTNTSKLRVVAAALRRESHFQIALKLGIVIWHETNTILSASCWWSLWLAYLKSRVVFFACPLCHCFQRWVWELETSTNILPDPLMLLESWLKTQQWSHFTFRPSNPRAFSKQKDQTRSAHYCSC